MTKMTIKTRSNLHTLATNRAINLSKPAPPKLQSEVDEWMALKVAEVSDMNDTFQEETESHPRLSRAKWTCQGTRA